MNYYSKLFDIINDVGTSSPSTIAQSISERILGTKGVFWETPGYLVSSFYADRDSDLARVLNSNPRAQRAAQRAAAVASNVPTHPIQGTRQGESENTFHVVTSKTSGRRATAQQHSLNTFNVNSILFPEPGTLKPGANVGDLISKSHFGAGKLEGVTSIRDRLKKASNIELTAGDKSLMYMSQFAGMLDLYGDGGGFDMWYVRDGSYTDAKVQRAWKKGREALNSAFGVENGSLADRKLTEQLMRVKRSADTEFSSLVLNDSHGLSSVTNSAVDTFGSLSDRAGRYVEALGSDRHADVLQRGMYAPNTYSMAASSMDPDGVTASVPLTPTPTPPPREEVRVSSRPSTPELSPTTSTPDAATQAAVTPDAPHAAGPIEPARPSFGSGGSFGADHSAYLNSSVDTSTGIQRADIDTSNIEIISQSQFDRIERTFLTGGAEHSGSPGQLQGTQETVHALQVMRQLLDTQHPFSSDNKFYENTGTFGLPKAAFDVRETTPEEIRRDGPLRKRLAMAGALVGVTEDGKQTWLVDDIGYTNVYREGNTVNPDTYRRNQFRLADSPTPEIDFDHNNWEIVNADMTMQDAVGNGYVMPLKDNKAIFMPAFTRPDMQFGLEYEVNGVTTAARNVVDRVKQTFGYDIDKMNFKGSHNDVPEGSLPHSGREYVSPIMEGLRGYKATYMFAEALKDMGGTTHTNRGGRNDPSGIHVNMGTVPDMNRKPGIQFAADFLRLTEDVFKKITTSDRRYRYNATSGWGMSSGVQPNSLPPRAGTQAQFGRQFWSQSMSKFREASGGMSEYGYYRQEGRFWGQASMHPEDWDTEGKNPKYRTVAMNKLQLAGVIEVRSPEYLPGGNHALDQLIMSSKLGADIYNGAKTGGAFQKTDKLVPPIDGWGPQTQDAFNKTIATTLGITKPHDQKFVWDMYQKCKAS